MRFLDNKAIPVRLFILQDPSDNPIYVEAILFGDPKSHYTFILDLQERHKPFSTGLAYRLRMFISWVPNPTNIDQFVSRSSRL